MARRSVKARPALREAVAVAALLLLVGCLEAPALPVATGLVAVRPEGLVGQQEPVRLIFSAPLAPVDPPLLSVRDRDDAPIRLSAEAAGDQVVLRPEPGWPGGEVLRVTADGELFDASGDPVAWPADDPHFEVEPAVTPPSLMIRWPTPGTAAAPATRWLAVEGGPADLSSIVLAAADHQLEGLRGEKVDGLVRYVLRGGSCQGLCAGTTYTLEHPLARPGVRSRVVTGSVTDARAPRFDRAEVDVRPGLIEVRWGCDEPVRVQARLTGPGIAVDEVIGLGRAGVWRAEPSLEPGVGYELVVTATDLTEQTATGVDRRVIGPAEVQVALREIVTTPRSDWGDSEPMGEPFDPSPGQGTVSSADEWIELVNTSEVVIDVEAAGLRVLTLDRTPSETLVVAAPALRFGDGGRIDGWRPGEALVVRPRGDMTQTDLAVEVWAGAILLDRVVLGEGPDADHPGGSPPDLTREALARASDGRWRWCRPTPGDPRPSTDCGR